MRTSLSDSAVHFKRVIRNTVATYQRVFPDEYNTFCKIILDKASMLEDRKFGQSNPSGNEMRALYEIPETLYNMIAAALTDEGNVWLTTKEGARWFAKTFRQFVLPDEI